MTPKLLKPREAAAYLGIPEALLRNMSLRGDLPCVRTNGRMGTRRLKDGRTQSYRQTGRLWFAVADLDAWVADHRTPAAPRRPSLPPPPDPKDLRPFELELPPPSERRFS